MKPTEEPALPGGISPRAEPVGIGGWLALLVVWMVVLRPVTGSVAQPLSSSGAPAAPAVAAAS